MPIMYLVFNLLTLYWYSSQHKCHFSQDAKDTFFVDHICIFSKLLDILKLNLSHLHHNQMSNSGQKCPRAKLAPQISSL